MATAAYYQQQRNFGAGGRQQPQYHRPPPPPVEKHVLFYSNHCEYSQELLAIIAQKGLRDRFYLVCVERHAQALPAFVTSVPLVFSESQQILVEDDLFLFINHLGGGARQQQQPMQQPMQQQQPKPKQQPQPQQQPQYRTCAMQERQQQQQNPDADDSDGASLAPFEFARIGDGGYSFIDEDGDGDGDGDGDRVKREAPATGNRNYAFLEADPSATTDAGERPPEPIDTRRSDKDLTTMLDKYKAERGME